MRLIRHECGVPGSRRGFRACALHGPKSPYRFEHEAREAADLSTAAATRIEVSRISESRWCRNREDALEAAELRE
jgi:hypothetical protein